MPGGVTASREDQHGMSRFAICCALAMAVGTSAIAAQKGARKPPQKRETLACRVGTEDRHARIAVVVVGGKTAEFAYYSKWKPRTCSIYFQRNDAYSKWADTGNITTVNLEQGVFLIEHKKNEYHFTFREIDRERYCGMDGQINGTLTIRKGSETCELDGVMEEGLPLGTVVAHEPPPAAAEAGPAALSQPATASASAPPDTASKPAAPRQQSSAPVAPSAAEVSDTAVAAPAPSPKGAEERGIAQKAVESPPPSSAATEKSAESAPPSSARTEKAADSGSSNPFSAFFRALMQPAAPQEAASQ